MYQPASFLAARTGRNAFVALLVSNFMLALGPWMVRLADTGPVASGFWRLTLAVPFLFVLAKSSSNKKIWPGWVLGGAILTGGLFFAADLAAWHAGIKLTKLANATLFGNMASLLFPVYGFIIARALPRKMQAIALLLAALGGILLLGGSYELSPRYLKGDLLAILAGIFYVFYLISIDHARRSLHPMPVLLLATIAGMAPLLLFALLLGEQVVPGNWTPLLLLSLGSQVVGQGLLVYAMGHLSPVVVGLGLLTQPAVSAMVGWMIYDERLSMADGIGALLICAALVLIRLPDRKSDCA